MIMYPHSALTFFPRRAWNKGRLVGQKPPLKLRQVRPPRIIHIGHPSLLLAKAEIAVAELARVTAKCFAGAPGLD